MYYSPLRYPGGKNKLSGFITKLCKDNDIDGHYIEPYAGGASVALFLLFNNIVKKITINDKDRSIYAFWHSVLNETNELCRLIEETELTVSEWLIQKDIQRNKETVSFLELGFSTLYLNRTNRSGIIKAGVMGGLEQNGNYLMDCRFNKRDIISRIQEIALKREDIILFQKDAIEIIEMLDNCKYKANSLIYLDPPYHDKGSSLYMNYYKAKDHKAVSDSIHNTKKLNWVVSYDNVPEIKELYKQYNSNEYSFSHTAYKAKEGKEILFFSENLNVDNLENKNPVFFKYKRLKEQIIYKERIKAS